MSTSKIIDRLLLAALLASPIAFTACDNISPHGTTSQVTPANKISTGGTVVFREKDGGFFGILSDNGGQLEPVNLDPQYRTDGLRVKLTGNVDDAHLGKHNWGKPIEIESVQAQRN